VNYRGKNLATYSDIIDYALSLKGKAQADFVRAYAATGPYALSNIGYFSGYYGPKKMVQIQRVFKTAHPIFGRAVPTPKEAFAAGCERVLQHDYGPPDR
jgi:hypothetical protein